MEEKFKELQLENNKRKLKNEDLLREELASRGQIEAERERTNDLEKEFRKQMTLSRTLDEEIESLRVEAAEKSAELERLADQSKLQEVQKRVCQTQRDDILARHTELRTAYSSHVQNIFELSLEHERITLENSILTVKK